VARECTIIEKTDFVWMGKILESAGSFKDPKLVWEWLVFRSIAIFFFFLSLGPFLMITLVACSIDDQTQEIDPVSMRVCGLVSNLFKGPGLDP
jgi:hypothetical protein